MENRSVPTALPAAAEGALADGRIIEAVKILRQAENIDLTQAKIRIDTYLAANPELKLRVTEKAREQRARVIKWVLVLDGIIVLVLLYWFFGR